ncbi:MAG: OB-fold putative lipoprotein [Bacteroidetes bacterium]|nr:OB-fold putative lipoprotein [Bacteroidota bacterium]
MKTRSLLILVAAVLLAIATAYAYFRWNQPPESLAQKDPDFQIKANTLLEEFQSNNAKSQPLYLNRILEIEGRCESIENQGDSLFFVYIGSHNGASVLCQLEKGHDPLPPVGQNIRCKGLCTGYDDLTGGASMDRCVLVNFP